jgi:hypothetical protein
LGLGRIKEALGKRGLSRTAPIPQRGHERLEFRRDEGVGVRRGGEKARAIPAGCK